MNGSQPGGHEPVGSCTSRVAVRLELSSLELGGASVMEGAPSPWPHTSCAAHSEQEQSPPFACN